MVSIDIFFRDGDPQTNLIIHLIPSLGTGEVFGEDISASDKPIRRSAGDVRALMNCEILYLTRESMERVGNLYPDFLQHFRSNIDLSFNLVDSQVTCNYL